MLKLHPAPTLRVPVLITVPGLDEPVKIEVEYRYMGMADLQRFFSTNRESSDLATLGHLIRDWSGVDGPYTPENLAQVLDSYPAAAGELMSGYTKALLESRVKN